MATGKRQRRLPELAIPARATYVADRRHRRVPVELQRPLWVVRQVRRRHLVAPLYVDEQRWAPRCGDVEAHVLRPRRELHRAGVVGEPRRRELGRRPLERNKVPGRQVGVAGGLQWRRPLERNEAEVVGGGCSGGGGGPAAAAAAAARRRSWKKSPKVVPNL